MEVLKCPPLAVSLHPLTLSRLLRHLLRRLLDRRVRSDPACTGLAKALRVVLQTALDNCEIAHTLRALADTTRTLLQAPPSASSRASAMWRAWLELLAESVSRVGLRLGPPVRENDPELRTQAEVLSEKQTRNHFVESGSASRTSASSTPPALNWPAILSAADDMLQANLGPVGANMLPKEVLEAAALPAQRVEAALKAAFTALTSSPSAGSAASLLQAAAALTSDSATNNSNNFQVSSPSAQLVSRWAGALDRESARERDRGVGKAGVASISFLSQGLLPPVLEADPKADGNESVCVVDDKVLAELETVLAQLRTAESTQEALQALFELLRRVPMLDLSQHYAKMSPVFRRYVQRGLERLATQADMQRAWADASGLAQLVTDAGTLPQFAPATELLQADERFLQRLAQTELKARAILSSPTLRASTADLLLKPASEPLPLALPAAVTGGDGLNADGSVALKDIYGKVPDLSALSGPRFPVAGVSGAAAVGAGIGFFTQAVRTTSVVGSADFAMTAGSPARQRVRAQLGRPEIPAWLRGSMLPTTTPAGPGLSVEELRVRLARLEI
jgi:hypothetical protein